MSETQISIGQVGSDIAELVNRVASGGERILLTADGVPKAALIGIEEYEQLRPRTVEGQAGQWLEWRSRAITLRNAVLERRGGQPLDLEALWQATRDDHEERDDRALALGHRR